MGNMGENFANSCRREDKMLRQGEGWRIVLKRREKDQNAIGRNSIFCHVKKRKRMQDDLRWVQESSGWDCFPSKRGCNFRWKGHWEIEKRSRRGEKKTKRWKNRKRCTNRGEAESD